jgi:hypothetical protein
MRRKLEITIRIILAVPLVAYLWGLVKQFWKG